MIIKACIMRKKKSLKLVLWTQNGATFKVASTTKFRLFNLSTNNEKPNFKSLLNKNFGNSNNKSCQILKNSFIILISIDVLRQFNTNAHILNLICQIFVLNKVLEAIFTFLRVQSFIQIFKAIFVTNLARLYTKFVIRRIPQKHFMLSFSAMIKAVKWHQSLDELAKWYPPPPRNTVGN
ncbi:hypothetical protein BpHYR1_024041 [Brachionus plicatilis]|uniref:Uncharacterized protein n=1 Tax=Brachionus plicatilis TaxID=10195 RepID=A0A3M7SIZ9_BRAPC|nr:hypothetical protein BpHYR1_024041 [Brachionus plicatilis]